VTKNSSPIFFRRIFFLKTLANSNSYDASDDRASRKIGKPMDRGGNADADIKRIDQRGVSNSFILRIEHDQRESHGEGNGRMGGRPAEKNSSPQNSEAENMADVGCEVLGQKAGRAWPAGEKFIEIRNQKSQQRGLAESIRDMDKPCLFFDRANEQKKQDPEKRNEGADQNRWKKKRLQDRIACQLEIKPIKSRGHEKICQRDRCQVPEKIASTKAFREIGKYFIKKSAHKESIFSISLLYIQKNKKPAKRISAKAARKRSNWQKL